MLHQQICLLHSDCSFLMAADDYGPGKKITAVVLKRPFKTG